MKFFNFIRGPDNKEYRGWEFGPKLRFIPGRLFRWNSKSKLFLINEGGPGLVLDFNFSVPYFAGAWCTKKRYFYWYYSFKFSKVTKVR